ncbi:MAG: hypothetical protein EZS28_006207 [Streblomastix strix]|uniref:Uncharacterized protein n=1 Tax=Streblomastix strix TaxID=222440 RepID=A0A5J4WTG6_9EUKA|nr:MAG: hypothetical protein EZS28_006207 [Streblomastix strix]
MFTLTILLAVSFALGVTTDSNQQNDEYVFYVGKNGTRLDDCLFEFRPCDKIQTVIFKYDDLSSYLIKLDNSMHDLDLGYIIENIKIKIALHGTEKTVLKLFNDTQLLENIQIKAHDLTLDITDVKLENFLRGSYNELTNVKIVRGEGQTAINQISIISGIDFKTLLDKVTIDGELKDGLEPLFQIGKLTQFTLNNSLIKNIRIIGQEYDQAIMRIDNLNSDSLVTIENTVISDTQSDSPNSQLILVQFSNPIVITPTTKPVLIIKGSTFQNSNHLSSIDNINAVVKLVDVKPELFKFINNTFNNVKSIEENEKDYEIMIYLTQGYTAGDVIPRFAGFLYNHNIKPIIIYEFGSTIPKFIFPGSYEYLTINSNSGTISCTKYDEDYNDEIKTLSCAMIIIRGQDSIDQLRLSKRSIEIEGEFSEIDLRTDGQLITFLGSNHIAASNQITFRPSVGSQPNDSLFRVTNGGELNLDSIQVTRIRSFIGAEEIPIVSVVPESGKYGQITSIPGILILTNSIISGTGSFSEKWSGKGINEICNLNYAPLIVGSSTGTVTLIGTTVTQSEGAGIYVYGGAQLSIDSTSTLISNGERVGSSLSGMQTHVVCNGIDASGYPITTSVEINSNALPSYSTNQETWVFADSFKECNSIIITPGGNIVGRIAPQATSGSITIKSNESGSKTVQTTVTGNNLNPCDRILFLEVRNQYGQTILSQNLNESSSNAAGAQWEGIDKFSLELPSSSFTDATSESKFSLRVVEYRKESQYDWVDASLNFDEQASPTEEEQQSNSSEKKR